jgi:hypothetical protein
MQEQDLTPAEVAPPRLVNLSRGSGELPVQQEAQIAGEAQELTTLLEELKEITETPGQQAEKMVPPALDVRDSRLSRSGQKDHAPFDCTQRTEYWLG